MTPNEPTGHHQQTVSTLPLQAPSPLLPKWATVSAFVGEILHASPLDSDAASGAVRMRHRYQEQWQRHRENKNRDGSDAANIPLLSADDVARFWTERRNAFVSTRGLDAQADSVDAALGDAAKLDLELKFLPAESLQELLAGTLADGSSAAESRSFVAINTICFFADGACASKPGSYVRLWLPTRLTQRLPHFVYM